LKFSSFANANHLLSLTSDNRVTVWDIEKHQKVHVIDEIKEDIYQISVSPDGGSYAISTPTTVYFYHNVWVGDSLNISESFRLMPYPFIGALLLKYKFLEADHRTRKEFILQYSNLNVRKYGWNLVHLICNFLKENSSHYLEACQSANVPFEVDNSGLTTFHYLIDTSPGKVDWQSVNLLLSYFISSIEKIEDRNLANLKKHQIISQISEILVPLSLRVNTGLLYKLLKFCVAEPLAPPGEQVITMGSIKNQNKNHGIVPLKSCLFADAKDQLISNEGTDLIDIDVVLLKLDYSPLSNDMLDMVKMLLALRTENYFRTRLFTVLIEHLWEQHRKFHYYLLIFFSFLMFMLSFYLTQGTHNIALEVIIFTSGTISLFYEVLQAYNSGICVYINDIWNVIDVFYHTLLLSVIFMSWAEVEPDSITLKWVRIMSLLMGYSKWVSFFRIHFQTRRLIRTIVEIIKALRGFSLVIILIIFGFTIAFLELSQSRNFSSQFLSVYSLIYANFSFDSYSTSQINLAVGFTIMLSIVLLNLMIAIMGDTYGKVQAKHTLTEGIEKLSLIMEAMIMKRPFARLFHKWFGYEYQSDEKTYLYFAEIEENTNIEDDDDDDGVDWEAKINHICLSINQSTQGISDDVKRIERKLEDGLNSQFALLKTEMLEKLDKVNLASPSSTTAMSFAKFKDLKDISNSI
jgi:Ion transport protein